MPLNKEDYVARISNATNVQLIIINYEILLDYLKEAVISFDDNKNFEENINKAQKALGNLMDSLDMKYDISKDLLSLYIYVNKLIINCKFFYLDKKDSSKNMLDEAVQIISSLLEGWLTVENHEENAKSVMENSQKIYAGLTYGKGTLNEYIPDDNSRGFNA